jgi:hypothetical protein
LGLAAARIAETASANAVRVWGIANSLLYLR